MMVPYSSSFVAHFMLKVAVLEKLQADNSELHRVDLFPNNKICFVFWFFEVILVFVVFFFVEIYTEFYPIYII